MKTITHKTTIEFFSGTKSFSKVAQALGYKTFTIDNDPETKPDLLINILDFKIEMLPAEFRKPFIVWASPPCQTFSVASISHYWDKGKPKNEKALNGIRIVKKTLEIIKELNPEFWFIENPRGMLRKQDFMTKIHKTSVSYCRYGAPIMKPTDIWNNLTSWSGQMCEANNPDHERASRGSRRGIQGIGYNPKGYNKHYAKNRTPLARGVIPPALFKEIFREINKPQKNLKDYEV
jgi:site-specific DNA-cytosine methylase